MNPIIPIAATGVNPLIPLAVAAAGVLLNRLFGGSKEDDVDERKTKELQDKIDTLTRENQNTKNQFQEVNKLVDQLKIDHSLKIDQIKQESDNALNIILNKNEILINEIRNSEKDKAEMMRMHNETVRKLQDQISDLEILRN
jgi:hypothetical protein